MFFLVFVCIYNHFLFILIFSCCIVLVISLSGTASNVFVYLFLGSLLYVPPYLLLWAASSVISGIQLAKTA